MAKHMTQKKALAPLNRAAVRQHKETTTMTNHTLKRFLDDYCKDVESPQPQFKLLGITFKDVEDGTDSDLIRTILEKFPDLRPKFEAIRAVINAAVEPKTPDEELWAAAMVFQKHRESGYLRDVFAHSRGIVWSPNIAE